METESNVHSSRSSSAWGRWLLLLAYLVVLIVIWSYKSELLTWIKSGGVSPALLLLLVIGLACVPVIPFSVVIGTMGYLYGPLIGALISLTGAWASAVLMYGLFRYAFRDRARLLLRRYRFTEHWTEHVERSPFRSIALARLLPIIPQTVVNAYAAAVPIPFPIYAVASLLGKMPGMLVFAFIGGRITGDRHSLFVAIGVYAVFLVVLYIGSRKWMSRSKRV